MSERLEVVIVGGGQAGLVLSYMLTQAGVSHAVLERGRIGESWRSQRWDSFHLNTPSWANELPGHPFQAATPDAFGHRDQWVAHLESYARAFNLPVRPHTTVTALERRPAGGYAVHTPAETLTARAVVLATGGMSRPRVPQLAEGLPPDVTRLSAGTYRNPTALPEGAVLVVGTGQSGCQIAEDLLDAGRRVYVSASRVGRAPRVYRGRDILAWWRDMRFFEISPDELDDPSLQFAAQPQVSGTNGGHTVSLQSLARGGATLLGRVMGIEGSVLKLAPDLREAIAFGDQKAKKFKADIDAYIARLGLSVAPPEPDPGEPPLPDLGGSDQVTALDLRRARISSIVWCTGFDADWSWVHVDVFDSDGRPRHRAGISDSPGLYFLGLTWLAKRKSGIIYGVAEDAERIAQHITRGESAPDAA